MYDRAVVVNWEERSAEKDDDWSGARPVSGEIWTLPSLSLSHSRAALLLFELSRETVSCRCNYRVSL